MTTVGEMVEAEARTSSNAPQSLAYLDWLLPIFERLGIWDAEVLEGCAWPDEVKFTGTLLSTVEAGQRVRVIVLKEE